MSKACKYCSKNSYEIIKNNIKFVNRERFFIDDDTIHNRFINSLFLSSYLEYFNYIQIYDKSIMNSMVDKLRLCSNCYKIDLSLYDNKKLKYKYLRDALNSYEFNKLVDEYLNEIHKLFDGSLILNTFYSIDHLENQIKVRLEHLRLNPPEYSSEWKGSDKYYIKLFKIPRILFNMRNLNLREHYYWRPNDFSDAICGHPMASHGWLNDSIENMESNGIYLTN